MRKSLLLLIFSCLAFLSFSQVVYEPSSNSPVYDLLDELASLRIISLNSIIKPYSRKYIAEKLLKAKQANQYSNYKLSKRIRDEVDFYLRDYGFDLQTKCQKGKDTLAHQHISYDPPGYLYTTNIFKAAIRPAFGAQFRVNENGSTHEFTGGGEAFGYAGKHIGFYANAKQTWQSEALVSPEYFTMEEGKVWKDAGKEGKTNTEWRGGISVAWNWGDLGVYKDRPIWGNSEHGSNILSGHAPSVPFIRLHLYPAKWIEFQYIHGWLQSNVVDSTKSAFALENGGNGNDELVYRKKFIAANMLTITPWRGLNISLGNSIIYSDVNPNPWYLIPVLFYNSVDAQKNVYSNDNGSNSQMFFDVCSRQIRHLSLYACLYIDELKGSRITDPNHYNFTSWKLGLKLSDLPLQNLSFTAEWTKTNPLTYKHYIAATNFTNDDYNMGHYLRDNSQEIYVAATYKPLRNLVFLLSYTYAEHGGEYPYSGSTGEDITALPVLKNLTWQNKEFQLAVGYEIFNRVTCFLQYCNTHRQGDVRYSPSLMLGNTNTLVVGVSLGWE